jgi:hypothetical protein
MNLFTSKLILVFALLGNLSAKAQRYETFAERPSKRQEKVQQARERFAREKEEARQWAKAHGLKMRFIDNGRISELMAIRNGQPIYYTTLNKNAAISTAANLLHNTAPYNLDGSNVTVGVWDGGPARATHSEFGGRITLEDTGTTSSHATHVCGTIGASGLSANAKGMAPAANIDSYDWSGDEGEMTGAAAAGAGEVDKIHISNHSYGTISGWIYGSYSGNTGYHWYGADISEDESDNFGQYDYYARWWDEIVYDAPYYLPFKAAGNDRNDNPPSNGTTFYYYSGGWQSTIYNSSTHPIGDGDAEGGYDTILPKGNAKNIMTVGSVRDAVSGTSRNLGGATMESYSGWGPADDGRVKPDIVANGYDLYSCDDDYDSDYTGKSGTSMATPNACGSAALLVDYYDDRFPGDAMRASTLKGLIIHTADDLGRPGPDYSYGWGLMNTLTAAELIKDYADGSVMRMTEALLHSTTNQSDTFIISSPGVEPLRITLCWTDPPGSSTSSLDSRTPRLVNDLDLKVIGPGGTHYPYKLSYLTPSANATTNSENNVDNVEQVYIETPVTGQYTIQIDYDGSLTDNEQWYSLLISGISEDSDSDGIPDSWEALYFSSPTGAVAGMDSDGDGSDNLTEYIAGTLPNDPNSVFAVSSFSVDPDNSSAPCIVNWNTTVGRLYTVKYADNLIHGGFSTLTNATDLPHTQNSYTDSVERATDQNYYRVDVRLP